MDPDSVEDLLDELHTNDTEAKCTLYIGYALCEVIRELIRIANNLERISPSPPVWNIEGTKLGDLFSDKTK